MNVERIGQTAEYPDVDDFLARLQQPNTLGASASGLFATGQPLVVSRAPGRLDVMGGIADYSGSLVLEMPVREAAMVALQRRTDRLVRIVSLSETLQRDPLCEFSLAALQTAGDPIDYAAARDHFASDPGKSWAAYLAGAFLVLMHERGVRFDNGANLLLWSQVPEGKGVSSSAAIEVAAMQAIAGAYGIALTPGELAVLCQKVENLVVGAPCGLMDQMTSACGQAGRLLALLCQPAEIRSFVDVPPEIEFWGIDSGVRHCVAGADYGAVRVGAFMGYRILAELAGLKVTRQANRTHVHIEDPLWHGYLANITPSVFESRYLDSLPERMSGREFLDRYLGTSDPITSVNPDRQYAVRRPTAHPIGEHFRVQAFAELLADTAHQPRRMELLGELMYQSHASYSACGLGCEGTDLLVELVSQAGPAGGIYGAKITGGGSGGTVAVLARRGSEAAIRGVAEEYARRTGHQAHVFEGSSPGAAEFGLRHLTC